MSKDEEPLIEEEAEASYVSTYLSVDGEYEEQVDVERVQVAFDVDGDLGEKDYLATPLSWCNSAAITVDREEDEVRVSISVGDPRGAFVFTVRRVNQGDHAGELVMHTPYPGDPMPHMPLTEIRPGTYRVDGR